jgi:hypothetical protein
MYLFKVADLTLDEISSIATVGTLITLREHGSCFSTENLPEFGRFVEAQHFREVNDPYSDSSPLVFMPEYVGNSENTWVAEIDRTYTDVFVSENRLDEDSEARESSSNLDEEENYVDDEDEDDYSDPPAYVVNPTPRPTENLSEDIRNLSTFDLNSGLIADRIAQCDYQIKTTLSQIDTLEKRKVIYEEEKVQLEEKLKADSGKDISTVCEILVKNNPKVLHVYRNRPNGYGEIEILYGPNTFEYEDEDNGRKIVFDLGYFLVIARRNNKYLPDNCPCVSIGNCINVCYCNEDGIPISSPAHELHPHGYTNWCAGSAFANLDKAFFECNLIEALSITFELMDTITVSDRESFMRFKYFPAYAMRGGKVIKGFYPYHQEIIDFLDVYQRYHCNDDEGDED